MNAGGRTVDDARSERWRPPSLKRRRGNFLYLVVDDVLENSVSLVLSTWPGVDAKGRLRFRERPLTLGADRESLEAYLAKHRRPRTLRDRPLRIGDVFAVTALPDALQKVAEELDEQRRLDPMLAPESWIDPPVYDVTADARDEAKVAFYAAVTPTLGEKEAEELRRAPESDFRQPRLTNARRWLGDNGRWLGATTIVLAAGVAGGFAADRDSEPLPPIASRFVSIESGPGITSSSFARFTFSGADRYECRLDGQGDFQPCTDTYIRRNLDERDHELEVRAAGGETVTTYPWAVVVPPEVEIRGAQAVTRVGSGVTFAFAPTSDGAERFQCRLDGEIFGPCESSSSQPYPASELTAGPHSFEVRSLQRGITGRPAIHTWLVSEPRVPPQTTVVRILSGPGITSETTARFTFSGAAEYECRLDDPGGNWELCEDPYEGLGEGDHTLEVHAVGSPAVSTYPWAIVIPPEVTIDAPESVEEGTSITMTFRADSTADRFECRLDGGEFAPCESPETYDVGQGAAVHTFEARAIERDVRGTPAIHVWTVVDVVD